MEIYSAINRTNDILRKIRGRVLSSYFRLGSALTNRKSKPPTYFDGRVPPPKFIMVETNQNCNLTCRMCTRYRDGDAALAGNMEMGLFKEIAHQTFPFVERFSPSFAGEPLMTKGLREMIPILDYYGVKIEMITNATLLNENMLGRILPVLAIAIISFDGATKQTFESLRIGAKFDTVLKNVQRLCRERDKLPLELRPLVGMNCVIMERNIRELPDIIQLASDLGIDFLGSSHVFPFTLEMQKQSLIHYHKLAGEYLEKALGRAEALGLPMTVGPLDQITAATVNSTLLRRELSVVNGVVEGFERKEVNQHLRRPWPVLTSRHPHYSEILARRADAWTGTSYKKEYSPNRFAPDRDSIWVCESLWNRTFVVMDGRVTSCCLPDPPILGSLSEERFEDIWNGARYRAMRMGLVRKQPLPACKGCQQISEITRAADIDLWLQGGEVPDDSLPPEITPLRIHAGKAPPALLWVPVNNVEGYEVEFSLDNFKTVAFSSSEHAGIIRDNQYQIPGWAWNKAPLDGPIGWRVFALVGRNRVAAGSGVIIKRP